MSDLADMAQEEEARLLQQALSMARRPSLHHAPAPCGRCHNCDASVPPGATFCDLDCRDDWVKRNPVPKV